MGIANVPDNSPSLLGQALLDAIRQAVKEAIREANGNGNTAELLTPEDLADRLKVPLSWVYEQSRQGNIPTHRIGRYIRFDLHEVIASQKKD
jgi:excisionase family DNA binding protein